MHGEVYETSLDRFISQLPPVVRESATDYVVAGRLTGLVRLGDRLGGRLRGHNGTYRVAVSLGESPVFACDCGRDQPCRHAAALAMAFARQPAAFADLGPLIGKLSGDAAGSALRYVVERCFGPGACDSSGALLELTGVAADADPLRLETFLNAVESLALQDRGRVPARVAELRERALALAERQGRTAAVRALAALVATSAQLLARTGWAAERELVDGILASARTLDSLLARGGLDSAALAGSLAALAEALTFLPGELIGPVLDAGSRISQAATSFLAHRLRAVTELAKAELALSPASAASAQRVRELVTAEVSFLLSHGRDAEAVALARIEARGPAGVLPLVEALVAHGQRDEAIAAGRDELGRASRADVPAIRRRLATLLMQTGKPEMALAYLAANYNELPDQAAFAELREVARQCGKWDDLREGALARLRATIGLADYAVVAVAEARALEADSAILARDILSAALRDLPLCPAGEAGVEWRKGVDTLLREARRQFRRCGDEPGWRELREECRRRYGI